MRHLKLITTDPNVPEPATWRVGEHLISAAFILDIVSLFCASGKLGAALYEADIATAVCCLMIMIGSLSSHGTAYIASPLRFKFGFTLFLNVPLVGLATRDLTLMLIGLVMVVPQIIGRLLDAAKLNDRQRLIEALAVARGYIDAYDNPGFSQRIGRELGSRTLRQGIDFEVRSLAASTRLTISFFGRNIRFTTDKEAAAFGADELANYFVSIAQPRFLLLCAESLIRWMIPLTAIYYAYMFIQFGT